jgi:hypothetical protein
MFFDQLDVLLVKRVAVDTALDQFWLRLTAQLLVLLVNRATVETGVDQSCTLFL